MSTKCESLVRARWVPTLKDATGTVRLGYWRRLADPEHCGENGMWYSIRKKAKAQKKFKTGERLPAFVGNFSLPAGVVWVKTALCDKHRKKAEREGNEVVPCEEAVQTVQKA